MQTKWNVTRRDFLQRTAAGVAVLSSGVWSELARAASRSVQPETEHRLRGHVGARGR